MSNLCKKIQKEAAKTLLKFDPDMYSTPYGSIVLCGLMFSSEDRPTNSEVMKTWKNLKRKALKGEPSFYPIKDEDFIKKTLEQFGMTIPDFFPIAMYEWNGLCVFAPYINGERYAIREDGHKGQVIEGGTVYELDFSPKEIKDND